jgi:hypothetical protein
MFLILLCGIGATHGLRFLITHKRMTSSGDGHQGREVEVQDKHLEGIICLNFIVHLNMCLNMRLIIVQHGGVIYESSPSEHFKKYFKFEESMNMTTVLNSNELIYAFAPS